MNQRNRIIYANEGIFCAANKQGLNGEEQPTTNLSRVESIDYGVSINRQTFSVLGKDSAGFNFLQDPAKVNFSVSYYSSSFVNESMFGLHIDPNLQESVLKNIVNADHPDYQKNIYLLTAKEGVDFNGAPIEDIDSVLLFGDCYLNSYEYNLSLGNPPQARANFVGENMEYFPIKQKYSSNFDTSDGWDPTNVTYDFTDGPEVLTVKLNNDGAYLWRYMVYPSMFTLGKRYRVSGKVYIPSTPYLYQVKILTAFWGLHETITDKDQWVEFSTEYVAAHPDLYIYGLPAGVTQMIPGPNDFFLLKDIKVTEILHPMPILDKKTRSESSTFNVKFPVGDSHLESDTLLPHRGEIVIDQLKNIYTSDFSVGLDGWAAGGDSNGTLSHIFEYHDDAPSAIVTSAFGKSRPGSLHFRAHTSPGTHYIYRPNVFEAGKKYKVSGAIWIASTANNIDHVSAYTADTAIAEVSTPKNTWVRFSEEITIPDGTVPASQGLYFLTFTASPPGSQNYAGGGTAPVYDDFYIADIVVTELDDAKDLVRLQNDKLQSLGINFEIPREECDIIGYKIPKDRKIKFPIQVTMSASFIADGGSDEEEKLNDLLTNDHRYDISIRLDNEDDVPVTKIQLRDVAILSSKHSHSVGKHKTYEVSAQVELDVHNSNRGLFISGAL